MHAAAQLSICQAASPWGQPGQAPVLRVQNPANRTFSISVIPEMPARFQPDQRQPCQGNQHTNTSHSSPNPGLFYPLHAHFFFSAVQSPQEGSVVHSVALSWGMSPSWTPSWIVSTFKDWFYPLNEEETHVWTPAGVLSMTLGVPGGCRSQGCVYTPSLAHSSGCWGKTLHPALVWS